MFHTQYACFRENHLILEKREKCLKVAGEHLAAGKAVAIGTYPLRMPPLHLDMCTDCL